MNEEEKNEVSEMAGKEDLDSAIKKSSGEVEKEEEEDSDENSEEDSEEDSKEDSEEKEDDNMFPPLLPSPLLLSLLSGRQKFE